MHQIAFLNAGLAQGQFIGAELFPVGPCSFGEKETSGYDNRQFTLLPSVNPPFPRSALRSPPGGDILSWGIPESSLLRGVGKVWKKGPEWKTRLP
jgi:hypothetical protein